MQIKKYQQPSGSLPQGTLSEVKVTASLPSADSAEGKKYIKKFAQQVNEGRSLDSIPEKYRRYVQNYATGEKSAQSVSQSMSDFGSKYVAPVIMGAALGPEGALATMAGASVDSAVNWGSNGQYNTVGEAVYHGDNPVLKFGAEMLNPGYYFFPAAKFNPATSTLAYAGVATGLETTQQALKRAFDYEVKNFGKRASTQGPIIVGREYFSDPTKWYRKAGLPEVSSIEELGRNIPSTTPSNTSADRFRRGIVGNYRLYSKDGYWYLGPEKKGFFMEDKFGSAHGGRTQAAKGQIWGGGFASSSRLPKVILEGDAPLNIDYGIKRSNFNLTPWSEVPIGGRVGFTEGQMPISNLRSFKVNPGGYGFTYNGRVIPEQRIEFSPVIQDYKGTYFDPYNIRLFQRKSKLTDAEKLGIPKVERNQPINLSATDKIYSLLGRDKAEFTGGVDEFALQATDSKTQNLYSLRNFLGSHGVDTSNLTMSDLENLYGWRMHAIRNAAPEKYSIATTTRDMSDWVIDGYDTEGLFGTIELVGRLKNNPNFKDGVYQKYIKSYPGFKVNMVTNKSTHNTFNHFYDPMNPIPEVSSSKGRSKVNGVQRYLTDAGIIVAKQTRDLNGDGVISGSQLLSPEHTVRMYKYYPGKKLLSNNGEWHWENHNLGMNTDYHSPIYLLTKPSQPVYIKSPLFYPSVIKEGKITTNWNAKSIFEKHGGKLCE